MVALQLRTQQSISTKPRGEEIEVITLPNMMEVVLTRLRDFSCKTTTFDDCKSAGQSTCREPRTRSDHCLREGCTAGGEGSKLDIECALAWLRRELVRVELWRRIHSV